MYKGDTPSSSSGEDAYCDVLYNNERKAIMFLTFSDCSAYFYFFNERMPFTSSSLNVPIVFTFKT